MQTGHPSSLASQSSCPPPEVKIQGCSSCLSVQQFLSGPSLAPCGFMFASLCCLPASTECAKGKGPHPVFPEWALSARGGLCPPFQSAWGTSYAGQAVSLLWPLTSWHTQSTVVLVAERNQLSGATVKAHTHRRSLAVAEMQQQEGGHRLPGGGDRGPTL